MLDTDLTAGKIRDALTDTEGLMDSNDRIVVVKVSLWASFRSMVPIQEIETPQEHPVKPGNVSSSRGLSPARKEEKTVESASNSLSSSGLRQSALLCQKQIIRYPPLWVSQG